ncbi:MAG: cell division topological specificity factor MinE [Chloroflexi bacterium]|nr:cell division topological specificity factor MinE [Chloroflexota bacterium]
MMVNWNRVFRRQRRSGDVARERLQLVLVHDRAGVSPELIQTLRHEIIDVISKYLDIDQAGMEINLTQGRDRSKLVANIPIRSSRRAGHTPEGRA